MGEAVLALVLWIVLGFIAIWFAYVVPVGVGAYVGMSKFEEPEDAAPWLFGGWVAGIILGLATFIFVGYNVIMSIIKVIEVASGS